MRVALLSAFVVVCACTTGTGLDDRSQAVETIEPDAGTGDPSPDDPIMPIDPVIEPVRLSPGYALTITTSGAGTVATQSASVMQGSCGAGCTVWPRFAQVTLIPQPAPGWQFTGWSGACVGPGPCSVAMTAPRAVTATFGPMLTVMNTGGGTVTSMPAGIMCPGSCAAAFGVGTIVTLVANPAPGTSFIGWSGACSGVGPCSVVMTSPRSVTAQFALAPPPPLSVSVIGSGTVTSNPAGIQCPGACSAVFLPPALVTLVASPQPGWIFNGWSGACTGTGACSISMTNQPIAVTAQFIQPTSFATVTVGVVGAGSVVSNPAGIQCPGACSATFLPPAMVTLTATPQLGWIFTGWSGACGGAGACTIALTDSASVGATFVPLQYTLHVDTLGGGHVMSTPYGVSCPGMCDALFDFGTTVTLSANPDPGFTFMGWSGACVGTGPCTVTMTSVRAVAANFTPALAPVQVSIASTHPGADTVTAVPAGAPCGPGCFQYQIGTFVVLSAVPDPANRFVSWQAGPCAGSTTPTCAFVVSGQTQLAASFDWYATVQIEQNGGQDTIIRTSARSLDGAIDCTNTSTLSGTCSAHFVQGQTVQLHYTPSSTCTGTFRGPYVSFWGDCVPVSGSSFDCSVTIGAPGTYTSEADVGCLQFL